jgi:hypothetical protein
LVKCLSSRAAAPGADNWGEGIAAPRAPWRQAQSVVTRGVDATFVCDRPAAPSDIVAEGWRFAGWSLYVKDGAAKYCHNSVGMEQFYVGGEEKLPTGTVNIRYHFDFDGGQPGAGGTGTIHVNDKVVAEGRIGRTVPFILAADETLDVGVDSAAPVTDDYPEGEANRFTARSTGCASTLKRTTSATSSRRSTNTIGRWRGSRM